MMQQPGVVSDASSAPPSAVFVVVITTDNHDSFIDVFNDLGTAVEYAHEWATTRADELGDPEPMNELVSENPDYLYAAMCSESGDGVTVMKRLIISA